MNDGPTQDAPAPGSAPAVEDGSDERDEALLTQLAHLRRKLAQSVAETGERVQETVEDAVRRGRMTRKDAHELAAAIVAASKRQTDEIRQELEMLLERGRRLGRRGLEAPESEPVAIPIEHAPDAPRTLAIARYDELTAVLVRKSLKDLSPEQLRAVREHEASHAKRKTVLDAVDRLLAKQGWATTGGARRAGRGDEVEPAGAGRTAATGPRGARTPWCPGPAPACPSTRGGGRFPRRRPALTPGVATCRDRGEARVARRHRALVPHHTARPSGWAASWQRGPGAHAPERSQGKSSVTRTSPTTGGT